MSSRVAASKGEVTGNSLTPDLPLGPYGMPMRGTTAKDASVADRGRWVLPIAAKAIDRVMSRKEAAILMGISEPKVSALAKGEDDKTFSLLKLGALGDPFWIAFHQELGAHYKLDDPAARVQRAVEMVSQGLGLLVTEAQKR